MTEQQNILELISQASRELQEFRTSTHGETLLMHTLRREPTRMEDFDCDDKGAVYRHEVVIWRENGTLLCVGGRPKFKGRSLRFTIYKEDDANKADCVIYGKSDAAIAETATFYWSLKYYENRDSRLEIRIRKIDQFEFAAFLPEQLARIFDANPERYFEIDGGIWSSEQSVILATRPYPLNIELTNVVLRDKGTAFVDALEARQPCSFGSFSATILVTNTMLFSGANLERLTKLDITYQKIKFYFSRHECGLLPLSMKTNALECKVIAAHFQPYDFDTLDIVAKDLNLKFYVEKADNWNAPLISFFNRMAELGHLRSLRLSIDFWNNGFRDADLWNFDGTESFDVERTTSEALINAIKGNPKLELLDLSTTHWRADWSGYEGIFAAMEDHKSLRKFIVKELLPFEPCREDDDDDDASYDMDSWFNRDFKALEKLLTRNRSITVYDRVGKRCSNGPRIDKLYLLNDIFNGSKELVTSSSSDRQNLVPTALIERASQNFQYSALLLSNHLDTLSELFGDNDFERMVVMFEEILVSTTNPSSELEVSNLECVCTYDH